MIESAELIERWSNAERVLALMPEHERQHHWNMGTWGERTQCGTVACAAGHCGLDPWFRDRGFKLEFLDNGRDPEISDVPGFFGLEGSARIFYNAKKRPVETVLTEIRDYETELRQMEALSARPGIPNIGQEWPEEGGIFAGARLGRKNKPDYYLIVGPEHDDRLDWTKGNAWAAGLSVGGHSDFTLPDKSEGHALWDRVRDLFQSDYYWLRNQHAEYSDLAWTQHFASGYQIYWYKDDSIRCRSVRRIDILSNSAI